MMSKTLFLVFIYNFITFAITAIECGNTNEIIVETKNGRIKGKTSLFNDHTINSFIGIRYAEPPVNELRFAKPKPVKSWSDIYDATHVRHGCWQKNTLKYAESFFSKGNMSEDCLFLNVWSPSRQLTGHNQTLLPVMFYIHGGAFIMGSSFDPMYNGTALATHDVVVVSINYRLTEFGFLYSATDEAPGNVAFWDQTLALKWVKDNVKSFGGNPENITIFGESAGSISVSALVLSPHTKGLFKRAILQSGSMYIQMSITSKHWNAHAALENSKKLSIDMGCPQNDQWLQCLKKVDVKKIVENPDIPLALGFQPIYGDSFLPKPPNDALKLVNNNYGIELLAGVTHDEGTFLISYLIPELNSNVTKSQLKELLKTRLFPESPFNFDLIFDFYLKPIDEHNQLSLKREFARIHGDHLMTCPSNFFAKDFASQSLKNKVYFYQFSYKPQNSKLAICNKPWSGVCHAEDLTYVFGLPLLEQQYSLTDKYFSNNVMQIWSNFAKSGDPLKPVKFNFSLSWPSYRDNGEGSIVPKMFELNPHKFGDIRTELFKNNCDELWKQYFTVNH